MGDHVHELKEWFDPLVLTNPYRVYQRLYQSPQIYQGNQILLRIRI